MQTRSRRGSDHLLQTPDTFVRSPLPGLSGGLAIVHAGPALGARFRQYTVEFEAGGRLDPSAEQRFVFVLDGEIAKRTGRLTAGGFAYQPGAIVAETPAKVVVIEKPYEPLAGVSAPAAQDGFVSQIDGQALLGEPDVTVQALLPNEPSFDFAVNLMTFQPGAALPMLESHVMEHGLLMLEGGGVYRLGDAWYPVSAGDFIWMAPFCPQWFGALGKTPAKYLIYKDWNRI